MEVKMATVMIELTKPDTTKVQVPVGQFYVVPHGTGSALVFINGGTGDERNNALVVTESPSAVRTAANA
jgi:NAD(P)H-flavin reductase